MLDSQRKIRVLIVDDSAVMRQILNRTLGSDPQIEVVGMAGDPYQAKDKIIELSPDVLTLDIEMPKMDGLTFLKILMKQRPTPVIIMSTLSQQGSSVAMEALHKGAVDVMPKPSGQEELASFAPVLIEKVKAAAISRKRKTAATMAPHALAQRVPLAAGRTYGARQLILIGASTGGTEAIKEVMQSLPGNLPGIAIVQHIPPHFSAAFANRLNTLCAMEVREAVSGDILKPGLALVAPGGYHMTVRWTTNHYRVDLNQEEPIWHQRPAVDALFFSAAPYVGRDSAACILTGMGRDGAEGLLELRKRGVRTFSQDERSSVVYGMPKVAWELGGSEKQVPLAAMARTLVQSISRSPSSRPTAAPMAT